MFKYLAAACELKMTNQHSCIVVYNKPVKALNEGSVPFPRFFRLRSHITKAAFVTCVSLLLILFL